MPSILKKIAAALSFLYRGRHGSLPRLEEELKQHSRQKAALAEIALAALGRASLEELMEEAARIVAEALVCQECAVFEHRPEGSLGEMAAAAWPSGSVQAAPPGTLLHSLAQFAIRSGVSVVVEDLSRETRFATRTPEEAPAAGSGAAVIVSGATGPFAVLVALAARPRGFGVQEAGFLQSVADVLAAWIRRRLADESLECRQEASDRAERMEAVGRLAGRVAGDFSELFQAIGTTAGRLMESLPGGHPGYEDLKEIHQAIERALRLVQELLASGGWQPLEPTVLDLDRLVRDFEPELRRALGEKVLLVLKLAPATLTVRADPGALATVLWLLASHATRAMPSGGHLVLQTSGVELDSDYAANHPGVVPGPHVLVTLTDTGPGMDRETRSRLFDPETPLAPVYGVVRRSGGHIRVYSGPGLGTTLKVFLPRVEGN